MIEFICCLLLWFVCWGPAAITHISSQFNPTKPKKINQLCFVGMNWRNVWMEWEWNSINFFNEWKYGPAAQSIIQQSSISFQSTNNKTKLFWFVLMGWWMKWRVDDWWAVGRPTINKVDWLLRCSLFAHSQIQIKILLIFICSFTHPPSIKKIKIFFNYGGGSKAASKTNKSIFPLGREDWICFVCCWWPAACSIARLTPLHPLNLFINS